MGRTAELVLVVYAVATPIVLALRFVVGRSTLLLHHLARASAVVMVTAAVSVGAPVVLHGVSVVGTVTVLHGLVSHRWLRVAR